MAAAASSLQATASFDSALQHSASYQQAQLHAVPTALRHPGQSQAANRYSNALDPPCRLHTDCFFTLTRSGGHGDANCHLKLL